MAVEGIGVSASVVALAASAYASGKFLYETISSIRDAPKIVANLKFDIEALFLIIDSLEQELKEQHSHAALSEAQKLNLQTTLGACRKTCSQFREKLDRLTRRSRDGHIGLLDRFKLQLYEKKIREFQDRLETHKSNLGIALESSSL